MKNKIDNNANEIEQREDLSNFEKIQFMQFEYDWQKQRKSENMNKAQLFYY